MLGRVSSCEVTNKISVNDLDVGWRAELMEAGGGVVMDLGWHTFDLLESLFGPQSSGDTYSSAIKSGTLLRTRPTSTYNVEDTAHVSLVFQTTSACQSSDVHCNVVLSRVGEECVDRVVITGEYGVLSSVSDKVLLEIRGVAKQNGEVSYDGVVPQAWTHELDPKMDHIASMFQSFLEYSDGRSSPLWDLTREARVTELITKVYEATNPRPRQAMATHFVWPVITKDVENAVITQLHTSISIYDKGGVFGEFEDAFKTFHNRRD
jgi:predicted dehydrogenase